MTIITKNSKSKSVKITTDSNKTIIAMYIQNYNGEEQVLQSKTFANTKNAEKWANKILN